ncbi:DNA topoisomerase IB [Seohaeicola zhoushanensis]|uniref:DNA topoisomerase n=1 Tax=Seohaeicola zhoushanensis TaxID=1569283 RepID=A0A8J3H2X0_9RHOB|nr:DNA topoisomerase IB [Seohaeicola zhoushanensis]GHF69340.1 DNA topoisomerase [Seohaeicola zhoushanensis]
MAPSDLPAGLTWYPDSRPGITRRRAGRGFSYLAPDGTTIARGTERDRIEALAVPPAYERVWISPRANGHLQATGIDARTRKQYRYHLKWTEAQSAQKYDMLPEFARALPRIRRRITSDLAEDPGGERFALAAALLLIDRLSLRVGNEEYARQNGSYGALTLQRRHLRLTRTGLNLSYTAKGGKQVRRKLTDRKLLQVLNQVRDLPGAELLTWTDDDGAVRTLSSGALNSYLAEAGGADFTAKTFRTWAGTLAAFEAVEAGASTIRALAEAAAHRLANTPAVARKAYIHPDVIALAESPSPSASSAGLSGLSAAENRLLGLLES